MKNLLIAAVVLLAACTPEWSDCKTCEVNEESATSIDGTEQIPVTVIVNVDVDQNQTQGQGQQQGQGQTQTQTQPGSDGGTVTKTDAGTPPDAGQPCDAGVTCRKVCVKTEKRYYCKDGKVYTDSKSCKCGVSKVVNQCVKEETQCK